MKGLRKLFERFEITMSAVAFAEAGEFNTAREIMREKERLEGKIDRKVKRDNRPRPEVNAARSSR